MLAKAFNFGVLAIRKNVNLVIYSRGLIVKRFVCVFYPRDAMLARVFAIATYPSVRPPHAGIVPSRAKAGS